MIMRQFITIQLPKNRDRIDLEVPPEHSIANTLPLILKSLNLPAINPMDNQPYRLWRLTGEALDSSLTFTQAEIPNFTVLILDSVAPTVETLENKQE